MDFPALQYILWCNQFSVEYSIDFAIFPYSSISRHQFAVLNNLQNLLDFRDNRKVNNSPCLERFIHYNVCQDPHKKAKLLEESWRTASSHCLKNAKKQHPGWQPWSNMIIMFKNGWKHGDHILIMSWIMSIMPSWHDHGMVVMSFQPEHNVWRTWWSNQDRGNV